jgi:16S rRNA (uracil1498-N3)-methyltransferase
MGVLDMVQRLKRLRVFVPVLRAGPQELHGFEARHVISVLRARRGTPIEAFDGSGKVARGSVVKLHRTHLDLELGEPFEVVRDPPTPLVASVALLKGDKLASVVKRLTEIGVTRIRLLVSDHCDVQSIHDHKLDRLQRVAVQAVKQSGRVRIPTVEAPRPVRELSFCDLDFVASTSAKLWPHEWAQPGSHGHRSVGVWTGPEGGWSDLEVEWFESKEVSLVTLGGSTLRAETAAVALAAHAAPYVWTQP